MGSPSGTPPEASLSLTLLLLLCCVTQATAGGDLRPPGSKRALRRAAARAKKDGSTLYKGQRFTRDQLAHVPTGEATRRKSENRTTSTGAGARRGGQKHVQRFKVLSLNVGSLSTLMWQELREYLASPANPRDAIMLQETHWSTCSEFRTNGWTAIHSGTTARADGVMTLVHPKHPSARVRYEEVTPGRVLRVQVQMPTGRVELFNCYQHPHNFASNQETLKEKRQSLLNKLGRSIQGIPQRATLIVAGDFQAELTPQAPLIGRAVCCTPFHVGDAALDPHAFGRFVASHGLVALNTWYGKAQPTQFNTAPNRGAGASQIDHILTRLATADACAKHVRVEVPPIGTWRAHVGHHSLSASVRIMNHFLLPQRTRPRAPFCVAEVTDAVRMQGDKARELLTEIDNTICSRGEDEEINGLLMHACSRVFPLQVTQPRTPSGTIVHLWQLRAAARYTAVQRDPSRRILHAWRALATYRQAAVRAHKDCKDQKRRHILDLLAKAEGCAHRCDQRGLYQVVRQLAPWKPHTKILLKGEGGALLNHAQEHAALVEHSRQLFAPRQPPPDRTGVQLPLIFTVEEVEAQLRLTKVGRAVPPGIAPAAAWKLGATAVAPLLQRALQTGAIANAALPSKWTDAWIVWLPKQGKAPSHPTALRPIGLMHPEAKCLAALLRGRIYEHIRPQLLWVPQFAYLPGRDLRDALARVHEWIARFRVNIAVAAPDRFAKKERQRQGTDRNLCVGGAILSLDLKQAFDRVDRAALVQALRRLGTPDDLVAAVIAIHDTSAYHIEDDFRSSEIRATRGIRQGCKLAPLLWVAISTTILHDLRDALSGPKRQGTTFADDTLCQWMIDTQEDVAQLDSFLGRVLEVMGNLGLLVNLAKTALLLKVRGPGARRALKPYIVQREGRKHRRISNAKGEALIPLATSVVYLGTHLTLEGGGKAVVQHRLAEARDREAKIKRTVQARRLLGLQHRIRIWQTCSVTSALFGIHPIGLSSTGAVALRQWFHRQLRAVTNEPAHINHIGNSALREKYGVQGPVDNLHTAASRKLEKLRAAEPDITNTPAIIGYWEGICEQLIALTTTRTSSLSPVPAPIWEEGVPCDVCGLYFSSTKTMRQHRARKRQVLVQVNPKEEAQYQPHEHSLNGLPQCKHCNLKLSSADALKQHVLTYACRTRKAVDQGAHGDAVPNARNNAERRTAEDTVTPPLSTGSPSHRPQPDAAPAETAPGPDLPLLRSREASAYLRQAQIPLQVLTDWAPKLLQYCGFCNHWIAQGGSVKEHIKRMHQCIWDAALERFDACCLAYESLILRDHPCELCHQTVCTKARHLRNCVVLAQVSIAQAWVKAGAPEANEVCSISPSDFNEATAKRLLWGGPEECSQGDAPLLRYVERQCAICGQQLTNQQDWRRHMRKVHKQTWEEAETHLGGTASRVQFVRPCKFCRVHFTKTPQLHSQKCLPLLQLAYIQQHHGRSVGPEGGGKTVGHDLTNGTHVGRRAGQGSASQVPQNQGAVWAASGKKGLGAEIGPDPGASSTTPDDGEDHCPTRDSPAAPGGGSQLDPVHGGRRARHHTAMKGQ